MYLEIDNRQCALASAQCFQSAADVAAFLGALASLGSLDIPYKIEAVQSEYPIPFNFWHLLPFRNPGLCLSPAPLLPCCPWASAHILHGKCFSGIFWLASSFPYSDWPLDQLPIQQKVGAVFSLTHPPFPLVFLCWVLFQNHYSSFF